MKKRPRNSGRKWSRRRFLNAAAALSGGTALLRARRSLPGHAQASARAKRLPQRAPSSSPRVAAIVTEYRPWSHADVIVGRFIQGYALDLTPHWPEVRVRALYTDQVPPGDLSRPLSRQYGIPIAKTIREAILDGQGKLAVDGVLLIGEHGNYPYNERGQHLYPRRRFFAETAAAFQEAGQVVPVFNDKHLSARYEDALWMYRKAKELGIPFLAGSSLPLTWREPPVELPLGMEIEHALAVGYGGLESYGFHLLETLQCMVERRRGGESGVAAVQCLEGEAVWEAMRKGRFSRDLLAAVLARHDPPIGADFEKRCPQPAAFLITYRDGLEAAALILNGLARHFVFGARLARTPRPVTTLFRLQEPVWGHFSYLSAAIMEMVRAGKPPYPVERTLLTTGILSYAMDSRFEGHRKIETADLDVAYEPSDHDLGAYRHPEGLPSRAGRWIDLFDGKTFDGWRENRYAGEPRWEIRDGILTGSGGQGYLATLQEFADFELFAEVRIADTGGGRGNSGIYFRVQPHLDPNAEYPPGYEVQLAHRDTRNPTGSIYNLGGEGARAPELGLEDGEWFTVRLRARGFRFETWVNGIRAADCLDPQGKYRRGAILLQLHHPTARVEVRELRVRPL